MDIFVEQLIKKKFGFMDYMIFTGVLLLGAFLVFLAVWLLLPIALLIVAGVCIAAYYAVTSRSLEFEYSVTNGDITIDKIISRRSRRRVVSVDARTVEAMGKYEPGNFKQRNYSARIYACGSKKQETNWYLAVRHPQRGNLLIVFNPNGQVLEAIRPFLTRQVARDAFGRS